MDKYLSTGNNKRPRHVGETKLGIGTFFFNSFFPSYNSNIELIKTEKKKMFPRQSTINYFPIRYETKYNFCSSYHLVMKRKLYWQTQSSIRIIEMH